jgi:hypothetical protein
MTAQRRLSRALALGCATVALAPVTAVASPRIDPPAPQDHRAVACTAAVPRGATAGCDTSSDFEAFAIALAGGGVLLVGGGIALRTRVRHRRAGSVAVSRS